MHPFRLSETPKIERGSLWPHNKRARGGTRYALWLLRSKTPTAADANAGN